uniref:ribosomal protein L23 n=1 Tax=Cephaleuros karstenii TaxID=1985640 RepID=UPI001EDC9B61|nr:ribosomal protein L23 [Cephaleuros karstenii]UIB39130.1 ribosomal protein L23 [Cephaleuros karstenii]
MTNFIKSFIFNNKGIISIVEKNQYVWIGFVSIFLMFNNNFYILHVDSKLKKPEIKKFCQEILNTPVVYVNTLNLPPKKRQLKMKRAFVKFIGTKDTINPIKNFMKINSFSTSPSLIRQEKININSGRSPVGELSGRAGGRDPKKKKAQENFEFKILPLDLETSTT